MKVLEKVQLYPWQYLRQGMIAARTIPGLKGMVTKALFLNGLILFTIAAALTYAAYAFIFSPILAWLEPHLPAWLHTTSVALAWLMLVALGVISTVLAVRISFKLLGVWYENLVEKVVMHHRQLPEIPMAWADHLHSLGATMASVAREIGVALLLLMLGFIPLVGPLLVFLVGGHWSGRGIVEPYITVLKGAKQPVGEVSMKPSLMTLSLGAIQVGLAIIPLVGWVLLPFAMVYQVIGLAHVHEKRQASTN